MAKMDKSLDKKGKKIQAKGKTALKGKSNSPKVAMKKSKPPLPKSELSWLKNVRVGLNLPKSSSQDSAEVSSSLDENKNLDDKNVVPSEVSNIVKEEDGLLEVKKENVSVDNQSDFLGLPSEIEKSQENNTLIQPADDISKVESNAAETIISLDKKSQKNKKKSKAKGRDDDSTVNLNPPVEVGAEVVGTKEVPLSPKEFVKQQNDILKPPKKKKKIKLIPIIIVFIFIGIIIAVIKSTSSAKIFQKHAQMTGQKPEGAIEEPQGRVQVKAYKVSKVKFDDSLSILGNVKASKQVDLRFETNGVLENVNFREGDFIERGAVIANLKPTEALLRITYNESKLLLSEKKRDIAQKKLERKQEFFKAGAIVEAEVVEANLEYQAAEAQVQTSIQEMALAKNEFEKTKLIASMDSFMGTREADPGEFLSANTKVGSVFDIDSVYVELGVIEKDIKKIESGQKVSLQVDAYPGIIFDGVVDKIPAIVEGKSRTMPLKIKVENSNRLLKPGMFVRSRVFVFEKEDVIMVPAMSLVDSDGDGVFDSVFAIEYGEVAQLKPVKIGYMTTDYVEITSGLESDQEVVVETSGQLDNGVKVEVMEVQEYGSKNA